MLAKPTLAFAVVLLVASVTLEAADDVKALFAFDGPASTKGWDVQTRGTNPQGVKGAVKTEVVPGRDGGSALRLIAQDAGRHRLSSPTLPDGGWRSRSYIGIDFWCRGDGSDQKTTVSIYLKRDNGKPYRAHAVDLYLDSQEWRRVVLRQTSRRSVVPDPNLSKLASMSFEGTGSYQLDIGSIALLPVQEIASLKPFHIETRLVEDGRPAAVIVPPPTPVGADLADRVRKQLKAMTGLDFPLAAASDMKPHELLRTRHAIVLGCMADNAFIEQLYRQWFTITDRWYPGPGGHVLRSVHSPYGTGRNVILLGGSDDRGLRDAVAAFMKVLAKGATLPWLMDIKLGDGHEVPDDPAAVPILLRPFADNSRVETGWHAAGKLALQYFYSGDPAYAQRFRTLVKEKPESISKANHYSGGQSQILVWDLIEESPVFSDAERLGITRLFLTHLRSGEASRGMEKIAMRDSRGHFPARHGLARRQAVAAETRYFARDYPRPEFTRYKELCDLYFGPLMGYSKTQNDVRISRYTTYLEPILSYALLYGRDDFLLGEPLRLWADRMVAHVPPMGVQTHVAPFITLRTVAQLRRDGQYRHIADLALAAPPASLSEFSSGQAWAGDVKPVKPTRYTGVCALPPEPMEFAWLRSPVEPKHGFDKVTLRRGFDPDSLWLQLDGVDGGPGGKRTPDVMAIKWLGCFSRRFLRFWTGATYTQNAVCVSRNGLARERPRTAELVATADLPTCGYVHARTKGYPWSHWSRHLVWDSPSNWIAVFDRVVATEPGHFLASAHWIPHGSTYLGVDGEVADSANGFRIVSRIEDRPPATLHVRNVLGLPRRKLVTLAGGELNAGEDVWLVHLLALKRGQDTRPPMTQRVGMNAFLIGDREPVLVGIGSAAGGMFGDAGNLRAAAFRIGRARSHLLSVTEMDWGGTLVQADHPVDIEVAADGIATIEVGRTTKALFARAPQLAIDGEAAGMRVELAKGRHHVTGLSWAAPTFKEMLSKVTKATRPHRKIATLPDRVPPWSPSAEASVPAKATAFAAADGWVVLGYEDGSIRAVDVNGKGRWTFHATKRITGLRAAAPRGALPWSVLVGSDDGRVYALDRAGAKVWAAELRAGDKGVRRSPHIREFLVADTTGDSAPEVVVANSERWLTTLNAADGSEAWAKRIPPHMNHGDLRFPRALTTPKGERQTVIGDRWFYGGGWMRVNDAGKTVKRVGGMWGGGRICGITVADVDGDGDHDVCVARYREDDVIEYYADGDEKTWTVWTDEPVTSLVSLPRAGGGHLIVAGTRSGWLVALDARGEVVWSHCLIASVQHLMPVPGSRLAAALSDGRLMLFDAKGQPLLQGQAGSADFRAVATPSGSALFTVTTTGQLRRFALGVYQ